MKKLPFLFPLLLVLSLARAQTITNTSAVPHTTGTPSGAPSTYGSWLRYDKTNKILYQWTGAAWTRVVGTVADGDKGSITVSGSGGTWSVDVGEGGIYEGSGTVPASTVATATNGFRMNSGASGQILLGDYGSAGLGGNLNLQGSGVILGTPGYQFRAQADDLYTQMISPGYTVRLEPTTAYTLIQSGATNGYKFWDLRATPRGVQYSADYSATYDDRSLVDKAYVVAQNATNANLTGPVTSVGNATTITANAIDSSHIANGTISPNDLAQRGASVGQVMTYTSNGWRAAAAAGANYLVYTALLSQSGTSAPVATVLENTLGGAVVWTRDSDGTYLATLSSAFPSTKTFLSCGSLVSTDDPANQPTAQFWRLDSDTLKFITYMATTPSDLWNACVEIRVYP